MSTVKISQLPVLTSLSANNANTLFVAVNLDTDTTGQFSTTTLAQVLFANNILNVGTPTPDVFPGLLAQFIANTTPYGQVNLQNINANGTMDVVITADTGTDSNNYIDLGIQNSTAYDSVNASAYYPLDGYLYVQGLANTKGGNLIVGTASSNTHIKFVVGGSNNANTVARFYSNGAAEFNGTVITRSSQGITFSDGSQQGVAAAPANYTQSAFNLANTVNAGLIANVAIISGVDAGQNSAISIIQGVDLGQNTLITSVQANTIYTQGVDAGQNSAISIIQGVDLGQNTLITSVQANTIYTQGVDATQNSWISSNNSLNSGINSSQNTSIGLAWNLANTSLQNTSTITVANNLIVPGNTIFNNIVKINANLIVQGNTLAAWSTASGLTATGTNQATAYPISTTTAEFTSAPTGTGAILPMNSNGTIVFVPNDAFTPMKIYPPVGGYIDFAPVNQPFTLSANGMWTGIELSPGVYTTIDADPQNTDGNITILQGTGNVAFGLASSITVANSITISGNTVPTQNSGTWTPALVFGTQGSQTYSVQSGYYVKTGKAVKATFNITTTAQSGTGNFSLNLAGLPAVLNSSGQIAGTATISLLGGSAVPTATNNFIGPIGSIPSAATSVPIYASFLAIGGGSGGTVTYRQMASGDLGATLQISGMIEYIANT